MVLHTQALNALLLGAISLAVSFPAMAAAQERELTVPPDVNGELEDGWPTVPTTLVEVCLVKSKPPKGLGIKCPDKLCDDASTSIHADKLDKQELFEKYPGSYRGKCKVKAK